MFNNLSKIEIDNKIEISQEKNHDKNSKII